MRIPKVGNRVKLLPNNSTTILDKVGDKIGIIDKVYTYDYPVENKYKYDLAIFN